MSDAMDPNEPGGIIASDQVLGAAFRAGYLEGCKNGGLAELNVLERAGSPHVTDDFEREFMDQLDPLVGAECGVMPSFDYASAGDRRDPYRPMTVSERWRVQFLCPWYWRVPW